MSNLTFTTQDFFSTQGKYMHYLTFGGTFVFLVPQRKPTTFPRGTILILTLAGGGVGVDPASGGSEVHTTLLHSKMFYTLKIIAKNA